jgi:hypothetical protein
MHFVLVAVGWHQLRVYSDVPAADLHQHEIARQLEQQQEEQQQQTG